MGRQVTQRKGFGMAGTVTVTNAKKGKKGKKGKAKRRRNPSGFIGKTFDRALQDGKLALPLIGGEYVGETIGALGDQYLGGKGSVLGDASVPVAQLGGYVAALHFGKNTPGWRFFRIGILAQAIKDGVHDQLGMDPPGTVLDLFAEETAPAAAAPTAATSGMRGMSKSTASYRSVNPYLSQYG